MRRLDRSDRRPARAGRSRLTPLVAVREWWWNYDRRRHIAHMTEMDSVRRLDEEYLVDAREGSAIDALQEEEHVIDAPHEEYVIDALVRQLEEIRNLPEIAL